MNIRFLEILCFGLALNSTVVWAGIGPYAKNLIMVTLDRTTLCYPASYSPDPSVAERFLAPVKHQLDESHGEQLVYIPAADMAKLVPGYLQSHSNQFTAAAPLHIRGILYPQSASSDLHALAKNAWNIYSAVSRPVIEKDAKTGLFKVYSFEDAHGPWHFVKSPPVRNPQKEFDPSWYVGHCGERVDSYDCTINLDYKGIRYEYSMSEYNMGFRTEIHQAIASQIRLWESNCHNN